MTWNKLLKQYSLNSDMQYFEMIVGKFAEDNKPMALQLFKDMPKQSRKNFVTSAFTNWNSGLSQKHLVELINHI